MTYDGFDRVGPVEFILKKDSSDNPYRRKMFLFLKFIDAQPFFLTEFGSEVVNTLDSIQKTGDFCFNADSESYCIFIPNSLPH